MDTYADDLAALVETLALKNAIHVGHSTGVVKSHAISDGTHKTVAKAVLIGSVTPLMVRKPANAGGLPVEAFDKIRDGVLRRSFAVLQGSLPAVLRLQQAG